MISNGNIIPKLEINKINNDISIKYSTLINNSGILDYSPNLEFWTSSASNKALSYYSHGIFRYFGKFPPPIARYLIETYTKKNDLVIDPMCGSGTTALEALLLGREAKCYDVNPLATLISKVKITKIDKTAALRYLNQVIERAKSIRTPKYIPVGLKNYTHWFLPETIISLGQIKEAIEKINDNDDIKDVLMLSLLSIVRRVSKATTQQGRLFLDVVTAEKDALPFFIKKASEVIGATSSLSINKNVQVEQRSILEKDSIDDRAKLIICHPPYFNSYKYSGVNSLELSWMNIDHSTIRKDEVREAFKVGKPEKVHDYIKDMKEALQNIKTYLKKDGILALMIGDTVLRGKYVPVTSMLLEEVKNDYKVDHIALRVPQFTEASWAASQRRKGHQVGINLCDLIVILKPI